MKLYTEEQVRDLADCILGASTESILAALTPIELPSDEELQEYINSTPYYGTCTTEYCEGLEEGAKWVINKIKGGKL